LYSFSRFVLTGRANRLRRCMGLEACGAQASASVFAGAALNMARAPGPEQARVTAVQKDQEGSRRYP